MSKKETPGILISDFDGVVGDSLKVVLRISQKITNLFTSTHQIKNFSDYYELFGRSSLIRIVNLKDADLIEKLLKTLIHLRCSEITLFNEILKSYSKLSKKPIIITSANSKTVKKILGKKSKIFKSILGNEKGTKKNILSSLKRFYKFHYVTDTSRDIEICKKLKIPVIAVSWGYEKKSLLKNKNPDYLAKNFLDLDKILFNLELYKNGKKT